MNRTPETRIVSPAVTNPSTAAVVAAFGRPGPSGQASGGSGYQP